MYRQRVTRNILYLPYMRFKGGNVSYIIAEMRKIQKMPLKEISQFQWSKLKSLLLHAYNNIPFYRERFIKASIRPDDIKCKEDLLRIPPLTKEEIRKHLPLLLNKRFKMQQKATSGSSGYPLFFYKDNISVAFWDAAMYECFSWHGIDIGDSQGRYWGFPIQKKHQIIERLKDLYMNRIRLSAFHIDDERCFRFYKKLLSFRPVYFYGYPNVIYRFCQFMRENRLDSHALDLKAVILTGEMLYDFQRLQIEETLGCKVVNEYGTTENGIIAFECSQGQMHIMATNIYLEVIKNGKYVDWFEDGDLFVTELNSHSIPFIRYRIFDRGSLSNKQCACGSNFPLMHNILGRADSFIITPDNRYVYDAILAYTLKKHVDQFSAFQEVRSKLTILVKKRENIPINSKEITKELCKYLGKNMQIEIIEGKEIPTRESGKLRYFTQRIENIM